MKEGNKQDSVQKGSGGAEGCEGSLGRLQGDPCRRGSLSWDPWRPQHPMQGPGEGAV